jgi:hypothetical protein
MMEDRPEADSKKLAGQFDEWLRGETLVGRMLANLKTGRLPEALDAVVNGSGGKPAEALAEVWNTWERGTELPLAVAEGLRDGGLAEFLVGVGDVAQAGE